MTDYLLDTNHLSPLITIEHPLRTKVLKHLQQGDTFAIPTLVLGEFLFGIGMLPRVNQNLSEWERIKQDFIYYVIDETDAIQSAKLRLTLRKQGWQLGLADSLIAVIALRNKLTLLTMDKDFQAVPQLKIENWRIP
jgi:tRNA(fMet)-specific endonuclease VapC